jgi:hypothetical protein
VKPDDFILPGFNELFSEIVSKIPRKRKRGRPRKYDNPTHRAYLKKRSNQILGALIMKKSANDGKLTVRQQQNLIRAERAQNILSKSENSGFLIHYFFNRNTLLGELGRIESKDWLIATAERIAGNELKGENARAEIRKCRFGDRLPHAIILLRKIRKAVFAYRNLYPYQSCENFKRDVERIFEHFKTYDLKEFKEEK